MENQEGDVPWYQKIAPKDKNQQLALYLIEQEDGFMERLHKVKEDASEDVSQWLLRQVDQFKERQAIGTVLNRVSKTLMDREHSDTDDWCSQMNISVRAYPMKGQILMLPECGRSFAECLDALIGQKDLTEHLGEDFDEFWRQAQGQKIPEQLKGTTRFTVFNQMFANKHIDTKTLEQG